MIFLKLQNETSGHLKWKSRQRQCYFCNLIQYFFFRILLFQINPKLCDLASSTLKLLNETLVILSRGDSLARDVVKMPRIEIRWEGLSGPLGPSAVGRVMSVVWEAEDGRVGSKGQLWSFSCPWDLPTGTGSWRKWPGTTWTLWQPTFPQWQRRELGSICVLAKAKFINFLFLLKQVECLLLMLLNTNVLANGSPDQIFLYFTLSMPLRCWSVSLQWPRFCLLKDV